MSMRWLIVAAAGLAACSSGPRPAADWQAVSVEGQRVEVETDGKRQAYCRLEPGRGIVVRVNGPSELRIHTRLLLANGASGKVPYEVHYVVDGGQPDVKKRGADRDPNSVPIAMTGGVGDRDSSDLRFGPGAHTLKVTFPEGQKGSLLVRLAWRPLAP